MLVGLMKDLVAKGWKMENGFKPGYMLKLEAGMLKNLPGTDIRASPHITSRITIWKKFHGSLQTMLNNNSDIGFNATIGLVQCHNECWDRIINADPNATNMRFQTWPLYDDWNEIFRMDHANDPTDHAPVDTPADMDFASESPAVDNSTTIKVSGKKRVVGESSTADRLCDVKGQFCRASDNRFNNLVQVIGYESTIGGARKELPKVLAGIPELTEDERIDAAHMFAKNTDCLEMFLGMADGSRSPFCDVEAFKDDDRYNTTFV
ncbi:hypothetical protein ACS0TY_021210 [Phlomoides rotata]